MWDRELEALEERTRMARIERLVKDGLLVPVHSFEQYSGLVAEAKKESQHRLFTNCYMMHDDMERLISLGSLYQMPINNGVAFVDDQRSHWRMFLYVDLHKKLTVPRLDRSILAENMYRTDAMTEQQSSFENLLQRTNFCFYMSYEQITTVPTMSAEKFWDRNHAMRRLLEKEGLNIACPTDEQLEQYEAIYRERIDIYTQTYVTLDERKKQRDSGLIWCVSDKSGKVYAIAMDASIYSGAIATRREFANNIYALALMYYSYESNYSDKMKAEKRSHEFGWISTRNTASRRAHNEFGIENTGKAMNQYVMAGFMY